MTITGGRFDLGPEVGVLKPPGRPRPPASGAPNAPNVSGKADAALTIFWLDLLALDEDEAELFESLLLKIAPKRRRPDGQNGDRWNR